MSSHDYYLRGRFPFADLDEEVVAHAARVLETSVRHDRPGGPQFTVDGLTVSAEQPEDAEEVASVARDVGFDFNASVIFEDFSRTDEDLMITANRNVVRVSASFAAWPQVRAVLREADSNDSLVMTIQDGHVVLNQDWDGWTVWPEVLAAVPQPYEMRSIRVA